MKIRPHTHCVCKQALKIGFFKLLFIKLYKTTHTLCVPTGFETKEKEKKFRKRFKKWNETCSKFTFVPFFPRTKRTIGFFKLLFIKLYKLNITINENKTTHTLCVQTGFENWIF